MREDFNRVLTEDPRRGSRVRFSQVRRSKLNATFDGEFSGGKESMMTQRRNQNKQNRKTFGDLLGPLEAWVHKQVGKKWDDVYSEVCRLFDRRSQIKDHVHQHILNDFVERNTALIDGQVCILDRWDGYKPVVQGTWSRREFYVHPVTGILCTTRKDNEPGSARKAEEEKLARKYANFRVHDRNTHLYMEDGLWYAYAIADRPAPYLKYICPLGSTREERLAWEGMSTAEREANGTPVWVNPTLKELFPETTGRYRNIPKDRYYQSKRVANRKLLKAHGLVGSAGFNSGEGKRSHREMSKYKAKV